MVNQISLELVQSKANHFGFTVEQHGETYFLKRNDVDLCHLYSRELMEILIELDKIEKHMHSIS